MSAPLLWIALPALACLVLYPLRRWYRSTIIAGVVVALLLGVLALLLPIEEFTRLGPWTFKMGSTLELLGRRFVLTDLDRPLLAATYLLAAFWFAAAYAARAGRNFVPLGLLITAALVAASAVEPFLYAALLIELAVLASVPILAAPGRPAGRGVLRFLTYQSLGMPFILLTGWMLTGVEASPGELTLITRSTTLLAFGFLLLLAIFPFHSWMPMLGEEAHPYPAAFVFLMLPWMVTLFGLGFLDRYSWLRNTSGLAELLQMAGLLLVLAGGAWAAFQRHLGRMLAYAVMVETGLSLLAISLPGGLTLHFAMLMPRSAALGVWALALSRLRSAQKLSPPTDLSFDAVRGLGRRLPIAAGGLVLAHFSVAGLPLLAGFPVRLALWRELSGQSGLIAALVLLGSVGLLAGGLRTLAALVASPQQESQEKIEGGRLFRQPVQVFLAVGALVLLLIGLMPQWFLPAIAGIAQAFGALAGPIP